MEGAVSTQNIKLVLSQIGQDELEDILAEKFRQLSPDAKQRVIGLSDTGLCVTSGFIVALNSQVAVNIQNSTEFDAEVVFNALAEYYQKNNS